MPTVSWSKFLHDSQQFVNFSNKINDGWELKFVDNDETPGTVFLNKKTQQPRIGDRNIESSNSDAFLPIVIDIWEYHVVYSLSYSVPVLYFNVYDSCGSRLNHDNTINLIKCSSKEMQSQMVSQTEHPLLMKPFYFIHPCRTAEFICDEIRNVIVCWLSVVAPFVNLALSLDYANI